MISHLEVVTRPSTLCDHRAEARMKLIADPNHLPIDTAHFHEEKFPNPYSHTIYLGKDTGVFPSEFALRIRSYGNSLTNSGQFGLLDLSSPCFLEIKYHDPSIGGATRKVRHHTVIGEAITIAQSADQVRSVFFSELPDAIQARVIHFFDQPGSCVPLCGVSYNRRHFVNSRRITYDDNIRKVAVAGYDHCWLVRTSSPEPYSIIELKQRADASRGEANLSKFSLARQFVGNASFNETGMDMRAEGDWRLTEMEVKIDTVTDPRATLEKLVGTDQFVISNPRENEPTPMQFIAAGDQGVCIMGREGVTARMAIKHKRVIETRAGISTREERVSPYSHEYLQTVLNELGGSIETAPRSEYTTRHRLLRLVVSSETGNVFAVVADHCTSEGQIPDLNQVEIEYRGKIDASDASEHDEEGVFRDLQLVSRWIYSQYRMDSQVPHFSTLTKYDWAMGWQMPYCPSSELHQGKNAFLEVVGEDVIKTYDLWGTIHPQQVAKSYRDFRAAVAQFYSLPQLREINESDTQLVVRETLIKGRSGVDLLKTGSDSDIVDFLEMVLLPLKGQILENSEYSCGPEKISRRPLATPVDIKPNNFIITEAGQAIFVDCFPPLNRQSDGSLIETYVNDGGFHDAWVYGEASVLITRFLLRCIRIVPEKVDLITQTVLIICRNIDQSGLLNSELRVNAEREKTQRDFHRIGVGQQALDILKASS